MTALAALLTLLRFGLFFLEHPSEFSVFYDAGSAWNRGAALYPPDAIGHNLNPPLTTVVLFSALAYLPLPIAKLAWLVASLIALAASLAIIARELRWRRAQTHTAAVLLLLTFPAWLAWSQFVWLLCLPATLSWRAYRRERFPEAGLWFAPVIALKPTLALVALFLPWRVWMPAGVASAGLTAACMLWTGPEPWLDWWSVRHRVEWINWAYNLSLWGEAGRILSGHGWHGRMSDIPAAVAEAIVLSAVAGWFAAQRITNPDRRMALAWLAGLLIAPIGWMCYLVIGFAAFAASWTRRSLLPWALLCVPFYAFAPMADSPWMWLPASVYTIGALLWVHALVSRSAD